MVKRAFILCTPNGDALINNGMVKCKSEDGLKEFTVESSLLENNIIEPFLITIDGTVYSIPTDEYIPVDETPRPSRPVRSREQTAGGKHGKLKWSIAATRRFIKLFRECSEEHEQQRFMTKREMWHHIARQMAKKGYRMDEIQVENRLKTLHRAYRNSIRKETGVEKSDAVLHFERELHAIFANGSTNASTSLPDRHAEEQSTNSETETGDLEEVSLQVEGFPLGATHSRAPKQSKFDPMFPSPLTCQSLMETVEEMDDAINTLSHKIDEESWGKEELLNEVHRLVAASGLIRQKLTEGATTTAANWEPVPMGSEGGRRFDN